MFRKTNHAGLRSRPGERQTRAEADGRPSWEGRLAGHREAGGFNRYPVARPGPAVFLAR